MCRLKSPVIIQGVPLPRPVSAWIGSNPPPNHTQDKCLQVMDTCAVQCDSVMEKCVLEHVAVYLYSRYTNLKKVVLDELLAKHGDAQLDAQLHETACMGTLEEERVSKC